MAILYCMGIPTGSWFVLNRKKEPIQKLQVISENLQDLEKGGMLGHLDPGPDKQEGNTQITKPVPRKRDSSAADGQRDA